MGLAQDGKFISNFKPAKFMHVRAGAHTITRNGRTAAFIVSPQDMDDLTNARSKRSKAVAEFEAWSQRAAASALPAAAELTDDDVLSLVKESR